MSDFLDGVAALDGRLAEAGAEFTVIRTQLNAALGVVHDTVGWLTEHGVADVRNALAGATPFLRMFGLLVGARYLAEGALSAHADLAVSAGDADYLLKVVCEGVDTLDDLLRHNLSLMPGLQRSTTMTALKTITARAPLTAAASWQTPATV